VDLSASFHTPVIDNLLFELGVNRCSRAKEKSFLVHRPLYPLKAFICLVKGHLFLERGCSRTGLCTMCLFLDLLFGVFARFLFLFITLSYFFIVFY